MAQKPADHGAGRESPILLKAVVHFLRAPQLPRSRKRAIIDTIAARPGVRWGLLRRCNVRENALFERLNRGLMTAVFVVLAAVAFPGASFAQVKVILSGGFTAAYKEVLPEFEKN